MTSPGEQVADLRLDGLTDREIADTLGLTRDAVRRLREAAGLRPARPAKGTKVYTDPTCRHCRRFRTSRPRGLCYRCFYTPGVRDLYPPVRHRGPPSETHRRLPATPCLYPPGSPEKIAAMAARLAAGEHLHHPQDLR